VATHDDGRKTSLFDEHVKLGGKIIPFGGWMMPVQYEGVLAEHRTVREACGIFDVSHMGEIRVKGPDAAKYVQYMTINDVNRLGDGNGQYTATLNEQGGFVDDLIAYRLKADEFFLVVNASNTDKDYAWFAKNASRFNVKVTNESDQWSQVAVQGPNAPAAVAELLSASEKEQLLALKYTGIMSAKICGTEVLVARTGYTGEKGYEIYMPHSVARQVWNAFLATAPRTGMKPIGLGARDTLRLEAGYLLYGNDMNDTVTPLEAGIQWAVRMDAGDFSGKSVLEKQKTEGLKRHLMCFKMEDSAIPRHDMEVYVNNELVGKVMSGSALPTVGGSGGMALLDPRRVKEGDLVEVDVRGKRKAARIVKRPLYSAKVK
jgi:aminomethyltransferase